MRRYLLVAIIAINSIALQATNYYVSKSGSDSNTGTMAQPFLTISKAALMATAGDTVFIQEGTYEEKLTPSASGTAGSPIVFQAFENDEVVITAMQALSGWQHDEGVIYKKVVDWDLGQGNFVLNGTIPCDLARWPNNTDGDPFSLNSLRNDGGSGETDINAYLTDAEIPDHAWENGGSIFFYGDMPGGGWLAWKSWITASSSGRVDFSLDKSPEWIRTWHYPAGGGDYYLEGIKEVLDYDNEWYFESSTKTLYLQLPNGDAPEDGAISMRKRDLTVDLNGRDYIKLKNILLFGGGVEINGTGNTLYNVSCYYGNMYRGIFSGFSSNSQSIKISGNNNTVEHCEIAYGAGSGITENGSYTSLINNVVHDFNYLGSYDAPMLLRGGNHTLIKNNTVYRGGRSTLQLTAKNSEVAYNDFSQSNLIADDCGLLYTLGEGLFMEIHHNLFHDTEGRGDLHKAAGVYLDNDAGNVDVHHNVIYNTEWSSIQINWDAANINIYNNTLWDGEVAMGAWHKEGTAFSNVKVYNNLTNKNSLEEQADKQNNLIMETGDPFSNEGSRDFTLKSGEAAIDYGIEIPGFTDGYVGAAPDAGAYESGASVWTAGADWIPEYKTEIKAEAGDPQFVYKGTAVALDGSKSYESNGRTINYSWTIPAAITDFSSLTASQPTFTAPDVTVKTEYIFVLVVDNGTSFSEKDTVIITVKPQQGGYYSGGIGSFVSPFIIANENDLLELSATPADWNTSSYFLLTNNLDMEGKTFYPIGYMGGSGVDFNGFFDGGNNVIQNLTVTPNPDQGGVGLGMFASADDLTVQNLGLINLSVEGKTTHERVGGILGNLSSGGIIQNCFVYGGTITGKGRVGGIVGYNITGSVIECFVDAAIDDAWGNVGGIVGQLGNEWSTGASIEDVAFYGTVNNVSGKAISGSVIEQAGVYTPTVSGAYYNADCGVADTRGTSIATSDLDDESKYVDLGFGTNWFLRSGKYAILNSFDKKWFNDAPVANAGPNQVVRETDLVTLDGSASSDLNSDELSYDWTAHEDIVFVDATIVNPSFIAPTRETDTVYVISLKVNDGLESSAVRKVSVTVEANITPQANAGIDQEVNEGIQVVLNGTMSSDGNGDDLIYYWTEPQGISLSNVNASSPRFTAPSVINDTIYKFTLVVNDGYVSSVADEVAITIKNINSIPVANAGSNQVVNEGVLVSLDGSASSDANGEGLTYLWTAPLGITLSDITAVSPTFTAPLSNKDTIYKFSLVVNDGHEFSVADDVAITVNNLNNIPLANAGIDQTVTEGFLVSLDGSASSDVDGESLTYLWTAPLGITLSDVTAESPSFTAPLSNKDTIYKFSLVVNDGLESSVSDEVAITITNLNNAPIANAGIDQTVNEGVLVSLNGSASSDVDGESLTYLWAAPLGITLSDVTAESPSFTAPLSNKDTIYKFSLVVNDGLESSVADEVAITITNLNNTPIAKAGDDQNVNEGVLVGLDGSASSDADGEGLTYLWSEPEGITLSNVTAESPTFTAPLSNKDTIYKFSLVVNDGHESSVADEVAITITNLNNAPIANAGIDQTVNEGVLVSLDGSASSDDDSEDITYSWSAPEGINLSNVGAVNPTFTAPLVNKDTIYRFTLIVNDGHESSVSDDVTISVAKINRVPIANAGRDKTVNEGILVSLDGSASVDTDGETLTYLWTAPEGIILSDSTVVSPTFTAPLVSRDSTYKFTLVVNNGRESSLTDEVVISVINVNNTPFANAGVDQEVIGGIVVTLDGSNSSDADGEELSYLWTAPENIALSDINAQKPTFTAPEVDKDTSYKFELIVNDGLTNSVKDEVIIWGKPVYVNTAPVADAGVNQFVDAGVAVSMDASASYDPDGDDLTYAWLAPVEITLSDSSGISPTFIAPDVSISTEYQFSLIVSDDDLSSTPSEVVITVNPTVSTNISRGSSTRVYPNPSEGKFTIHVSNNANIEIYDIVGNLLLNDNFFPGDNQINLSDYGQGVYFLKVQEGNNYELIKLKVN